MAATSGSKGLPPRPPMKKVSDQQVRTELAVGVGWNNKAAAAAAEDRNLEEMKRLRKAELNRDSARRSRDKKLRHKVLLEDRFHAAQVEVNLFLPQVTFWEKQRSNVSSKNEALKMNINSLMQVKNFKIGEYESMEEERVKLVQLFELQLQMQQQKQAIAEKELVMLQQQQQQQQNSDMPPIFNYFL